MSDTDIYLAGYFPDSAALSKRFARHLDNFNSDWDGGGGQIALLGSCLQMMNDDYKKILYPKVIKLWTKEIEQRKDAASNSGNGMLDPPPFGFVTPLDNQILDCLRNANAAEYIAPHRKELNDILSTFDRSKDSFEFVPKFEKLLGQNTEEKPEK